MTTPFTPYRSHRRRRIRLVTAGLAAAALILGACSSSDDVSPVTAGDLDGNRYVLVSATGIEIVDAASITLEFDDESIAGSTGCNRMFGGFEIDEGRLVTGELATTKMACEPALMDQETQLLGLLSNSPTLALEQDQLLLGTTGVELVFDRV